MCVCGACGGKCAGAFDKCMAAGVGVGVDEDELAGGLGECGEEGIGFGVGVAEDGDGVPRGENAWAAEV